MKKSVFIFVAAFCFGNWAHAQDQLFQNELGFGIQSDLPSGWLSDNDSALGYVLSYHIQSLPDENGVRSFFDLQLGGSSTKAVENGGYPFVGGEDLTKTTFAFVPQIGFLPVGRGHFFAGLGPQLITVSQTSPQDSVQTYGVFLWQAGYKASLSDQWSWNLKLNYSDYQSEAAGERSFFANFGGLLQLMYRL